MGSLHDKKMDYIKVFKMTKTKCYSIKIPPYKKFYELRPTT